jgi:hypothetical protein
VLRTVDIALKYAASGLSVIPIKSDGSKAPTIAWQRWQSRIAPPDEIRSMFRPGLGVSIVAGIGSGNLEILDIEAGAPFQEFCELIREHDAGLLDTLPHVETPSGGHHLFYRCYEIEGNQKLAMWTSKKVMFETRGRGGYVLTVGSPAACHPDKREYRLVHGSLTEIPRITPQQRDLLLSAARSFNQIPRQVQRGDQTVPTNGNGTRPGDVLQARMGWPEIIECHWWKPVRARGEETLWCRPGKDCGISATTNYRGSDLLYVFSTNAFPFEAETAYSKFAAYTHLNHADDYRAAARALAQRFDLKDTRLQVGNDTGRSNVDQSTTAEIDESASQRKFKVVTAAELLAQKFSPREFILEPILQTQGTGMLYSKRGVGKTYLSLGTGCAVAAGGTFLRWQAAKPRKVLYMDGEMPAITMQERLAAILKGMETQMEPSYFRLITPDLQAQGMPSLSGSVGQTMVEDQLDGTELLILDNISTLCRGGKENEAESWLPVQEWVLSLRRRGISVLLDHHAGKSGEQRGTSRREDVLDTVIVLRHPSDYELSQGARFEIHFEKARNVHGTPLEPFEVTMQMDRGAAVWLMRDIADVRVARAKELFGDGMSVRDVAEELKISKSAAHRLKAKLGSPS